MDAPTPGDDANDLNPLREGGKDALCHDQNESTRTNTVFPWLADAEKDPQIHPRQGRWPPKIVSNNWRQGLVC
jgi:hypothetical protein